MSENTKLTRKQKAFADFLLNNPKASAAQAIRETYPVKEDGSTARTMAAQNLANPSIQIYMEEHVDKAKNKIVSLVGSEREEIALSASKDILDRVHGKATQRVESSSTSVNLNLTISDISN